MRKTEEVDNLLNSIADSLEAGSLPSLEDCVTLEGLRWDYLEWDDPDSLLKGLGLRIRRKKSAPTIAKWSATDTTKLNDAIDYLRHGKMPPHPAWVAAMIRAYTEGSVTVGQLFGERYRKPRLGVTWQIKGFMGELAYRVKCNYPKISVAREEVYGANLFRLLSRLCSDENIKPKDYGITQDELSAIEKFISNIISQEVEVIDSSALKVKSISMWRESYVAYKKALRQLEKR